jgi:DNA polymerase sigma
MKSVPEDYGKQLEYFLDFFGNKFNPKVFGVNVVNRGSLFVLDSFSSEHVVTIDPTNKNNNTTRSSFKIQEVICEFAQAHARLKEILVKGKKRPTLKQIFKKFNR